VLHWQCLAAKGIPRIAPAAATIETRFEKHSSPVRPERTSVTHGEDIAARVDGDIRVGDELQG
jgi:hypothetical protein